MGRRSLAFLPVVLLALIPVLVSAQTPPQQTGFVETFDGAPAAPQIFSSARWILLPRPGDGLVTNHDGTIYWGDVEAGHGPHCESPMDPTNPNHIIPGSPRFNVDPLGDFQAYHAPGGGQQQGIYTCNNHMMTTVKDGRGAATFMPRYGLDWSDGHQQVVQFDVSPYAFARAWWELYIAPIDEFTLDTAILSEHAITFSPLGMKQISGYHPLPWPGNGNQYHSAGFDYCGQTHDPACNDLTVRRQFKITFDSTSWRIDITGATAFTFAGTWPKALDFTTGALGFSHWTYNPTKDDIPPGYYTYHWDNVVFDGPRPLMTGYPLQPAWIDTDGHTGFDGRNYMPISQNPSPLVHVNVTSSDLRNPRLWGVLGDAGYCGQDRCDAPSRTDPADTTRWVEFRVNSSAWLPLPSVRDPGSDFVDEFNSLNLATSHTFRAPIPANELRQGDNTVQFRSAGPGINLDYAEIQVDPNSDLPPPFVVGGPTPGPSSTVVPTTTPLPTAVNSATPTTTTPPTPTVAAPTATAVPAPATVQPTNTPGPCRRAVVQDGEILSVDGIVRCP